MVPNYSAIDGDISYFFDALVDVTSHFSTVELRRYLLNEGHNEPEVDAAIHSWQEGRFQQVATTWDTFTLTAEGEAVVAELRDRLDQ